MTASSAELPGPEAERAQLERSWVAHLRAGGTTTWADWVRGDGDPGAPPVPARATYDLPGAAQLELVRLLNEAGGSRRAEQVLARPAPGRGPQQLQLPWPPEGGPAAPPDQVLRVASGVLADLAAELPPAPAGRGRRGLRGRWGRPGRRGGARTTVVIEGPPVTVAELRGALARAAPGVAELPQPRRWHRHTPEPDLVVVVVPALDEALREAWSRRVQAGSTSPWRRFLAAHARRDELPPSADLTRAVGHWSRRVGADRVHLVTTDGLLDKVGTLLEAPLSLRHADPLPGDPARLTPLQLDVLRRVNRVLPFQVREEAPSRRRRVGDRHARLAAARTALVALLAEERQGPAGTAEITPEHLGWAEQRAARLVEALGAAGPVVHGSLEQLRRFAPATGRRTGTLAVLDATVRLIGTAETVAAAPRGARR